MTSVNDAPVLSGANNFTPISEDQTANSGDLVSTLISGKVSDVDSGAVNGIAVSASETGGLLRLIQSGRVQQYALMLFAAVALLGVALVVFH